MGAEITEVVSDRHRKKAWIALVIGTIVFQGALVYIASTFFHYSFNDAVVIAGAVCWLIFFTFFIKSLLKGMMLRGSVLLDCGVHPSRSLFLVQAFLFIPAGIMSFWSQRPDYMGIIAGVLLLGSSLFWLLLIPGHLKILENGIWLYYGLLEWNQIKSYEWIGKKHSQLHLNTNKKFSFLGDSLSVPPDQKQAVTDLLREHIAGTE